MAKKEQNFKSIDSLKQVEKEVNASKDRIDYLNSLVILLYHAIKDLQEDLASA